jgi:hypothetical protein
MVYLFEELQVGFPWLIVLVAEASHLRRTNMPDISRLDPAASEAVRLRSCGAKQRRHKSPTLRSQL